MALKIRQGETFKYVVIALTEDRKFDTEVRWLIEIAKAVFQFIKKEGKSVRNNEKGTEILSHIILAI